MNKGLNYFWTYCLYHSGAKAAVDYVNIVNAWKPILIFQKPPLKRRGRGYDYIISEQAEKDGHDWQQSESGVSFLIDHFSDPGELILEPFTGSGTTLIAAKKLNRKCIGAELNPETFNIAKARIANATGGQI
jgi:DNA modification methylase